jgi:predicted glycosyltransferase
VTGPFFPEPAKSALSATAETLQVEFHEFLPDLSFHLQRADLVISMGGYNTVTEILSNASKALIVPRSFPRKEQLLRAQRLSQLGLVSHITQERLTPDSLYEAVTCLLNRNDRPLARAREKRTLPLEGAARLAALCRPLLEANVEVSR